MLTTKLSWAKPNIGPQYTTLSGGGKGEGAGRKTAVSKTISQTIRLMHHIIVRLMHHITFSSTTPTHEYHIFIGLNYIMGFSL